VAVHYAHFVEINLRQLIAVILVLLYRAMRTENHSANNKRLQLSVYLKRFYANVTQINFTRLCITAFFYARLYLSSWDFNKAGFLHIFSQIPAQSPRVPSVI